MKPILLTLLAAICLTCYWGQTGDTKADVTNAVIGDAGFIAEFGSAPDARTDEQLRIKSHLKFVEGLLRKKDVSKLSPEQRVNRLVLLDHLHAYWTAGAFPKNYDHPGERRPCFIDRDGNICAVGHLVEMSAGRGVAEEINTRYKYAYITQMELPVLARWIENSGFTLEECAMIQPSYASYYPPPHYIEPGYAIGSALFSGANASFMTINGIQLLIGSESKVIPALGLVTGTGQLVYGLANYPTHSVRTMNGFADDAVTRNVSMLNIGLGTGTVIMSAVNLFTNKRDRRTSWNVFSFPVAEEQNGVGLSMVKRF